MLKMTNTILLLSLLILPLMHSHANSKKISNLDIFLTSRWKLSLTNKKNLQAGEVITQSWVETKKQIQTFKFKGVALHNKNCKRALRKLSMLENYSQWISFIHSSKYNDKNKLFTILAKHTLLPYDMVVHILVDRPTKEGVYKFTFPTGMFSGLRGTFEIKEISKRCILFTKSQWTGRKTNIPDFVIELFTQTLSKLGGEVMIRKTQ